MPSFQPSHGRRKLRWEGVLSGVTGGFLLNLLMCLLSALLLPLVLSWVLITPSVGDYAGNVGHPRCPLMLPQSQQSSFLPLNLEFRWSAHKRSIAHFTEYFHPCGCSLLASCLVSEGIILRRRQYLQCRFPPVLRPPLPQVSVSDSAHDWSCWLIAHD